MTNFIIIIDRGIHHMVEAVAAAAVAMECLVLTGHSVKMMIAIGIINQMTEIVIHSTKIGKNASVFFCSTHLKFSININLKNVFF